MGSPRDEMGRQGDEPQHEVTLTQAFYIGVFEVTQKQWERVMGDWPSHFSSARCRDARPVDKVCYNDIRGAHSGAVWPITNTVDAISFMGRMRTRTGKTFDLPSEAQWEYSCRADTDTALNSGQNLTSMIICPNLSEVGRCKGNSGDGAANGDVDVGTAKAGSYLPNAWGLYDMHGNVWEWCLDWRGDYPGAASDPEGSTAGASRVRRGGGWNTTADFSRSASRSGFQPFDIWGFIGFRVVLPADQK